MGTSETSLSSHTSSRSCPCSRFAHFQELEGGRVDWENRTIIIRPFCEMTATLWMKRKAWKTTWGSWDLHCLFIPCKSPLSKCSTFYCTAYCGSHNSHIIPPFLLVLHVKSSENSKTLVLVVVHRAARRECYWLNGMTKQGQLPAFTLSSSSWHHAAQIVKAPTGSHFKYFRNLPNHILLSQLMAINVSTACHNQTG